MVTPLLRRLSGLLILLVGLGAAEPRLEFNVPPHLIPGKTFSLRISLHDSASRMASIDLPEVPGLKFALDGGSQGSNSTIVNGQVTSVSWVGVELEPERIGTYTIPAVTAKLRDGTTVASAPCTLTISGPRAELTGAGVAEASFAPSIIVPGEESTCTWTVFVPYEQRFVPLTPDRLGLPTTALGNGPIEEVSGGYAQGADGSVWRIVLFRQTASFASPGQIESSGQVDLGQRQEGFLNSRIRRAGQIPVKPATLTITALPTAGRPANFAGMVGALTITAAVERREFRAGEGTRLTITVTGRRIDLLGRLPTPVVPGVAVYEQPAQDAPGARIFLYDLVPEKAGRYTIPPVRVPWFDPASRSYQEAASEPIEIEVIPGRRIEAQATGSLPSGPGDSRPEAPRAVDDLPPFIRGQPHWRRQADATWLALLSLAIGGLVAGLFQRLVSRPRRDRRRAGWIADLGRSDLGTRAAALHALLPSLDPSQRPRAERILAALESARFGGAALPDGLDAELRDLAGGLR